MYTFGILVVFSLLLSAALFGKKIKERQFEVVCIVLISTFLGMVIVNGIVGLKIPFTSVVEKSRPLGHMTSEIRLPSDTIHLDDVYLEYYFNGSKDSSQTLDFSGYFSYFDDDVWPKVKVEFLPAGDTIPRMERSRPMRIPNSNWVSQIGLPKGKKVFTFFIPNDSVHQILMTHLKANFLKHETEKTAQLN